MSSNLVVTEASTTALTPYRRKARTHSKKQIRQIAESIERFGFTSPVLIDAEVHRPESLLRLHPELT